MVVKNDRESGQSLLEFVLMLPMMIGLVVVLLRVNTAIQVSIVNQQYARAQALFLAYNSPVYPPVKMRELNIVSHKDNQMVVLVANNPAPDTGTAHPEAATYYIARKKGFPDSDDKSPSKRANVRIRDTVTLCTQPNMVQAQGGLVPVLDVDPTGVTSQGFFKLTEDPHQFNYCASGSLQYPTDASDGGSS